MWDQERAPGAARPEVRFLNRSVDRAIAASIVALFAIPAFGNTSRK